jgi:hypothetical protein
MMVTGRVNADVSSESTHNDSGSFAKQSFPPGGLVAMSRIAYQNTPLSTEKIAQGVFVFRGAGGNVTAISGSDGCAVIDTGYGPRVDEIKNGIASAFSSMTCYRRSKSASFRLIETGLTVSEIIDASPTAEFDSTWGKGYVTGVHFLRMVLAGLQQGEQSTAHSLQPGG